MNARRVRAQQDLDGNEQLHDEDEEAKVTKQVFQVVWSQSEHNPKVRVSCVSPVESLLFSSLQPLMRTFDSRLASQLWGAEGELLSYSRYVACAQMCCKVSHDIDVEISIQFNTIQHISSIISSPWLSSGLAAGMSVTISTGLRVGVRDSACKQRLKNCESNQSEHKNASMTHQGDFALVPPRYEGAGLLLCP
jgi:hypothetical protein